MGKSGTIHMCHLNNYYSIRQRGTDWVNTGKPGPGQMMMSVCVKCNLDPSQASQKQILLHQTVTRHFNSCLLFPWDSL